MLHEVLLGDLSTDPAVNGMVTSEHRDVMKECGCPNHAGLLFACPLSYKDLLRVSENI